jgi:Holliday junction resolvase RusA-like endonuclease
VEEMKIIIPFRTPTINHMYWHRGNIKIMTTEAKKIRADINEIVCKLNSKKLQGKQLKVIIDIYEDWKTKKGELKKKDVLNREKFLNDSVFESLGIDDKFIFEQTFRKIQSNEEKSVIEIEAIK